jgi:hypothetical protein
MSNPTSRNVPAWSGVSRLIFIASLLLWLTAAVGAQTTTSNSDGTTPAGLAPGSTAGSYALSGFDSVNLFNGNLNLRLPLLNIGGRGGDGYTMLLALNLKGWNVRHFNRVMPDENELHTFTPRQFMCGGSSDTGYGVGKLKGKHLGLRVSSGFGGSNKYYSKTLARLTFVTADGTEYELRDQLSGGAPLNSTFSQGALRGTVFVTADGSAATYVSDTPIYDDSTFSGMECRLIPTTELSGYLMLRDGTRFRIDGGNVTWMRDRNGNRLSFTYSASGMTVTDSLNRQVSVTYDVAEGGQYGTCDHITFKGTGGAPRTVRVCKTNLQDALRTTQPTDLQQTQTHEQLFPELNGANSLLFNPIVTSSVWLPDGVRRYQFFYNVYGELARVVLPTGGAVEYDMTPGSGVVYACPLCNQPDDDRQIYRRVVERRVYAASAAGTPFEHKTVYSNSETVGGTTSTVTVESRDPTGNVLSRSRHLFDGSALDSLFGTGAVTYPYSIWYEGREKQTEALNTAGNASTATVLRRVVYTWAQRAPVSWWAAYASANSLDPAKEPPNDPRLVETVTTIEPSGANLVAKQSSLNPQDPNDVGFDQYNNQTDVYEYDFGVGQVGALKRRTHTDYVNALGYTDASGAHLRNLPAQTWVSPNATGSSSSWRSLIVFEVEKYALPWENVKVPKIAYSDNSFLDWIASNDSIFFSVPIEYLRKDLQVFVRFNYEWEIIGPGVTTNNPEHRVSFRGLDFSDTKPLACEKR